MGIEFSTLVKSDFVDHKDFSAVEKVAHTLREYIEQEDVLRKIKTCSKSNQIENILLPKMLELDFEHQKKGLFSDGGIDAMTPDFYCKVGSIGIMAEIELGKTLENNNDILDLWKCHVCSDTSILFLIIPTRHDMSKRKRGAIYERVRKRISRVFEPQHYMNVNAVYLFGF